MVGQRLSQPRPGPVDCHQCAAAKAWPRAVSHADLAMNCARRCGQQGLPYGNPGQPAGGPLCCRERYSPGQLCCCGSAKRHRARHSRSSSVCRRSIRVTSSSTLAACGWRLSHEACRQGRGGGGLRPMARVPLRLDGWLPPSPSSTARLTGDGCSAAAVTSHRRAIHKEDAPYQRACGSFSSLQFGAVLSVAALGAGSG